MKVKIENNREKEGDLTQYYDKTLIPTENSNTNGQHKHATNNFDYTTIAYRLQTVSWSNNSHQTGVVNPVYGYPTLGLVLGLPNNRAHFTSHRFPSKFV